MEGLVDLLTPLARLMPGPGEALRPANYKACGAGGQILGRFFCGAMHGSGALAFITGTIVVLMLASGYALNVQFLRADWFWCFTLGLHQHANPLFLVASGSVLAILVREVVESSPSAVSICDLPAVSDVVSWLSCWWLFSALAPSCSR